MHLRSLVLVAIVYTSVAACGASVVSGDDREATDPPVLGAGPVCGDGVCTATAGEDGTSCSADCCDALTACDVTRQGLGTHYCRSFDAGPFHWVSVDEVDLACDADAEVCRARASCAGHTYYCKGVDGLWDIGACAGGDGVCNPSIGETCASAPADCGPCSPVCGDGFCSGPEDGASCGQDCCDAQTPCSATHRNLGAEVCRSVNGGAYQWMTEAEAAQSCDTTSALCAAFATCGGATYYCKANGVWSPGACTTGDGVCSASIGETCANASADCGACPAACGDGICNGTEDGASCGQDCCDATTACGATYLNAGDQYCRSINDAAYAWITAAAAALDCDHAAEVCTSYATCGGTTYSCKGVGVWQPGACGVGDGVCTPEIGESCANAPADCGACAETCGDGVCSGSENGASCGQDCCDAQTACSATYRHQGVQYCRSMHGGAYQWITEAAANVSCDATQDVCSAYATCAGETYYCKELVGIWNPGACTPGDGICNPSVGETCANTPGDCGACPPVCGDGVCNGAETGASCGQDCCDAQTACDATYQGGGVQYCRSMNGGAYGWITEPAANLDCDETADTCTSYASCGGVTYHCKGYNVWHVGACGGGDGVCNPTIGETCANAPGDCGACTACGDSDCDGQDDCTQAASGCDFCAQGDPSDVAWQQACPSQCADTCYAYGETYALGWSWDQCYGWCVD